MAKQQINVAQLTDIIPYQHRDMIEQRNIELAQHDALIKFERRAFYSCQRVDIYGRLHTFYEPLEESRI